MQSSTKTTSGLLVVWLCVEVPGPHRRTTVVTGHCHTDVKPGVALSNCTDTRGIWPRQKMTWDTIGTVYSYPKSPLWREAHHFLMTPREGHHQDQRMDVSGSPSSAPLTGELSVDLRYLSGHGQAGPAAGQFPCPCKQGLMASWWGKGQFQLWRISDFEGLSEAWDF